MVKKYLILLAILSGVALAWAAPPQDKLPALLGPPEALARAITVVVGGSTPAAPPAGNSDSFTGSNGTALDTHDSHWDIGAVEGGSDFDIGDLTINSNQLNLGSGVWGWGTVFYNTSTTDTSQAVVIANGQPSTGPAVRVSASSGGYGFALYDASGGNYQKCALYKNGLWLADIASGTWAVASAHTLKIVASGTTTTTLTCYIGGAAQGSPYEDSSSPITSGNSGLFIGYIDGSAHNVLDDWQDY